MNNITLLGLQEFESERKHLTAITQECLQKCEHIEKFKPVHNIQQEVLNTQLEVKKIGVKWQCLRKKLIHKFGLQCFCLTSTENAIKLDFGVTSGIWETWLPTKKIMQATLRGLKLLNDRALKKEPLKVQRSDQTVPKSPF